MSFNSTVTKMSSQGAQTAFTAPLAAYTGSKIALNTITAGSTASTAGLVVVAGQPSGGSKSVEFDSLAAVVETNITTSTLTVTTKWQVSNDGTDWIDFFGKNTAANVTKAAAGTGSLVTTQYVQAWDGVNPQFPYVRLAAQVGVATGGAGDSVTVAYNYRLRFNPAP